jgi:hypothetical protein
MQTDLDVVLVMAVLHRLALRRRSLHSACCRFLEAEDSSVDEEGVGEANGLWKEAEDEFRTMIGTATSAVALRKCAGLVSVKSASGMIDIPKLICVATYTTKGIEESVNFFVPRWRPRNLPCKPKTPHLFLRHLRPQHLSLCQIGLRVRVLARRRKLSPALLQASRHQQPHERSENAQFLPGKPPELLRPLYLLLDHQKSYLTIVLLYLWVPGFSSPSSPAHLASNGSTQA